MFSKKMIASANDVPKNDRLFERFLVNNHPKSDAATNDPEEQRPKRTMFPNEQCSWRTIAPNNDDWSG
jgi:hypothetical protein